MKNSITLSQLRTSIGNIITPDGLNLIALSPLNKLANASLSAKMMFWSGRIANDCRKEFELFEKQRIALAEKHRTPKKDEQGEEIPGQWEFTEENLVKFNDEFNELLEEKIEIELKPFTVEELENYSTKLEAVDFNGNDMNTLDWLIVLQEEPEQLPVVESIAEHQAKKERAA